MKRTTIALALVFLAGTAGAALAGEHEGTGMSASPQTRATFQALDTNHDGYIEKSEASKMKPLSRDFDKVSKDGKIDEADFAAWEASQQQPSSDEPSHETKPYSGD